MKDELQSKLVEVLTSIQSVAGKAGDFAMEQLPEVAQSYVAYGQVSSLVWVAFSVALCALSVLAAKWGREQPTYSDSGFFAGLGSIIGGLFGVVLLAFSVQSATLVWFAPKVWLLKEIASLVK